MSEAPLLTEWMEKAWELHPPGQTIKVMTTIRDSVVIVTDKAVYQASRRDTDFEIRLLSYLYC